MPDIFDQLQPDEGGGDIFDKVASSMENEKKTSVFDNSFIDQAIKIPATDLYRGFSRGMADVVRPGASVMSFINPISGIVGRGAGEEGLPDKYNILKLSQLENERAVANVPETNLNGSIGGALRKGIYETIGEAPGITAEFLQGEGLLRAMAAGPRIAKVLSLPETSSAAKGLAQALEFGLVSGTENINKGPLEAARAASSAGTVGMAFPVASTMYKGAKKGIKAGAEMLFGDEFANNPNKFTLNPLKKVENPIKARSEAEIKIQNLRQQNKEANFTKREELTNQINQLRESHQNLLTSTKESSVKALESAKLSGEKTVLAAEDTLNKKLLGDYDHTLKVLNELKTEKGLAVEKSLTDILDKNPKVSLPYRKIAEPFNQTVSVASKNAKIPFKIEMTANGVTIVPKTGLTNKEDLEIFQKLYQDINSRNSITGYEINYLQTLKGELQDLSDNYFKQGKGRLGSFYQDLSKTVNPVNVITSNPELASKLPHLAKSNAEYSKFIKNYDEAISNFAKKDANGQFVPDFKKVMQAVETNDIATIRKVRMAEQVLNPNDRILPKVEQTIKEANRFKIEYTANLKKLRRDAIAKQQTLIKQQRTALQTANTSKRKEIFETTRANQEKLMNRVREINNHIEFLEKQDDLRKWLKVKVGTDGNVRFSLLGPLTSTSYKVGGKMFNMVEGKISQLQNPAINKYFKRAISKTAVKASLGDEQG